LTEFSKQQGKKQTLYLILVRNESDCRHSPLGTALCFLLCTLHNGDNVKFDTFDELERQKVTKSRMCRKTTEEEKEDLLNINESRDDDKRYRSTSSQSCDKKWLTIVTHVAAAASIIVATAVRRRHRDASDRAGCTTGCCAGRSMVLMQL